MNIEAFRMFSMEKKVVVITGGAGFLGMQYAKTLTDAGAKVIPWDICGNDFVDITSKESVERAMKNVIRNYGRVDVLINNAAMNPAVDSIEVAQMFAPYEKYPPELFRKEVEIDLIGMHLCIQAVAPHMMKRHKGVIVNIASEYANIAADNRIYGEGQFKSIAYITAKAGVLGLTRGWASYLGKYDIRVIAFAPGGMPKPEVSEEFRKKYSSLNMLDRMADPGEYSGAILFLCSDASSFMTGAQLIMDGGKSAW